MPAVTIAESAVKELKKIIADQNLENPYVRVGITGGGCSGFQYSFAFADDYNAEQDSLFEQDGLNVIVDRKSALYLDGTTVNFYEGLEKRGFTFDNPNAVKTCGCGSSFQA